ncbi:MAG: hypothetical protein FJZ49_01040 [Candidatus Verstraetearchaeota archaeon]|nr:hypothetical protein [Candidatus Verstraetearchaeota archaeon]
MGYNMGSERSGVLERVKRQILTVAGTLGAAELNMEQRQTVAVLEEKAMGNVLGGMGRGRNEGVTETLKREVVMVFFVDANFVIPEDPQIMVLMHKGEVVGWTSMDPSVIKRYKEDKNYLVLSDYFIIKKDAKISAAAFASGDSCFIFKGAQMEEFSRIPEIKDHIISIPSPPGFAYLHTLFKDKMGLKDPRIGGFLIGFNLR